MKGYGGPTEIGVVNIERLVFPSNVPCELGNGCVEPNSVNSHAHPRCSVMRKAPDLNLGGDGATRPTIMLGHSKGVGPVGTRCHSWEYV